MTTYSPATERAISSVQKALRKQHHLTRDEAITWLISAAADYSVLAGDFRRECSFTGIAWRTAELLAAIRDITREHTMTVSARAHEIPGGSAGLEDTAQQLFGRGYRALTDGEAEQVWDEIDPDTP